MSAEEKGRPGIRNVATCGAQSLYQASANRLFGQRTVMRRGQYIQRNTRPQSMANFVHSMRDVTKPNINNTQTDKFNSLDNFNSVDNFNNADNFDQENEVNE